MSLTVLFFLLLFSFFLFFLLLEKMLKLLGWGCNKVHSLIYCWWNRILCVSLFFFWIHIIPILRKGRRKNCVSCTYLWQGLFLGSFLLQASGILQNLAGCTFLLSSVQRFCSILFTGTSRSFGFKPVSLSTDFCPQTKDSFPNFLWRKGIILALKGLANHFAFFLLPLFPPVMLLEWPAFPSLSNRL